MNKKIDYAIELAVYILDRESAPTKMSIQEAIDFWEGIAAAAGGRLDALHHDLESTTEESRHAE